VISIIGVLVGLLFPALNAARSASRRTTCTNNLRQFGIVFHAHSQQNRGPLCSGAFDWVNDGSVTDFGWVADCVAQGVPVGQMLCPANPNLASETLNQLLTTTASSFSQCVDPRGKPHRTAPDGTLIPTPCRKILEEGLAPLSDERAGLIQTEVVEKFFNTNFVASWMFVRSQPRLDPLGNLQARDEKCPASIASPNSSQGPLNIAQVDASKVPSNLVPLLGDGATAGTLSANIGELLAGALTSGSFTRGPVRKSDLEVPHFSGSTKRKGPDGWWAVWDKEVLQDYRGFSPVHRGICDILMADGSVRGFIDKNDDGLLNNGFSTMSGGGFADDTVEIDHQQIFSKAALRAL
jgi:hypothetical protein